MTTAVVVSAPDANERLKRSFDAVLATSLVVATVLHVLVLQLWPVMEAPRWGAEESVVIDLVHVDEIMYPADPEPLMQPLSPIASRDVPIDATIDPVDFREFTPPQAPPPTAESPTPGSGVVFAPVSHPPRLTNSEELRRALERAYPPALRDTGLGGTVILYVHVSETGSVLEAEVGRASSYEALDRAALSLAGIMCFQPARNYDRHVPVWIAMPVEFRVR